MGVLEAAARIVQLAGTGQGARVAEMRRVFQTRTGAFAPEDPWFEERSRAFWSDALTRERLGREVEAELSDEDRLWLAPLERAHRGLFRHEAPPDGQPGDLLVDVWSGAELVVTTLEDESRAELEAAAGQLLDARIVGADDPVTGSVTLALLPGAVFHSPQATTAIRDVIGAARTRGLSTHETLDALLRMERTLRALTRVKPTYAYRAEALTAQASSPPWGATRRERP
jgi:hypothetical protein